MSDVMMFGIAKMPYEMAMKDELSRRQFHANTQRLVAALEAVRGECDALLDALRKIAEWPDGGNRYGQENIKRFAKRAIDAAQAPPKRRRYDPSGSM